MVESPGEGLERKSTVLKYRVRYRFLRHFDFNQEINKICQYLLVEKIILSRHYVCKSVEKTCQDSYLKSNITGVTCMCSMF